MNMSLRVADYMSRRVITVSEDMDVTDAVHLLVKHDISGAPVVDKDGRLTGILTERDCLAVALSAGYFDEPGGHVADYMTSPVETVTIDESLMDIAVRFRDTRYRRFPVMQDGKMVGVISRRDVLRALQRGSWFRRPK
jgi:CBS domain-containing protein